jgi:hypothetical protein
MDTLTTIIRRLVPDVDKPTRASEPPEQAEAEIVARLRAYPPVIGRSQMAAWNTAAHIKRKEYKEPKS